MRTLTKGGSLMKKVIMYCEGCGKELQPSKWPWLYRSIGHLCEKCKKLASDILSKKEAKK